MEGIMSSSEVKSVRKMDFKDTVRIGSDRY